ncbi:unnamed protein product [Ectocarpus sp. 4 AP-2014]
MTRQISSGRCLCPIAAAAAGGRSPHPLCPRAKHHQPATAPPRPVRRSTRQQLSRALYLLCQRLLARCRAANTTCDATITAGVACMVFSGRRSKDVGGCKTFLVDCGFRRPPSQQEVNHSVHTSRQTSTCKMQRGVPTAARVIDVAPPLQKGNHGFAPVVHGVHEDRCEPMQYRTCFGADIGPGIEKHVYRLSPAGVVQSSQAVNVDSSHISTVLNNSCDHPNVSFCNRYIHSRHAKMGSSLT